MTGLAALEHLPEHHETLAQAIDLRFDLRNALLPLDEQADLRSPPRRRTPGRAAGQPPAVRADRLLTVLPFSLMGEHDRAIAAGQQALALATSSGAFASRSTPRTT